jgi:tripartite ATP-independent transporter DctM subunit
MRGGATFLATSARRFPSSGVAFKKAFLALLTPVIIMYGIFGGIFTPTEAAAVAAIYALMLGLFIYGDLKFSDLPRIFKEAVNTSAVVGFIVAGASLFSWVLARERVPQQIAEAFLAISENPHIVLLVMNVVMLVLGCFMEGIAIMILMVPVFMPVIQELGIDVNHFGVIVVSRACATRTRPSSRSTRPSRSYHLPLSAVERLWTGSRWGEGRSGSATSAACCGPTSRTTAC